MTLINQMFIWNQLVVFFYCRFFCTFGTDYVWDKFCIIIPLHKKWSYPLRISSVNVTFVDFCGFGHITPAVTDLLTINKIKTLYNLYISNIFWSSQWQLVKNMLVSVVTMCIQHKCFNFKLIRCTGEIETNQFATGA